MNTVAGIGLNRQLKDTITTRVIGIIQNADIRGMKVAGMKVMAMKVMAMMAAAIINSPGKK